MIQANELRLGNMFWESYGGYKIVTAIGCNKVGDAPNTVSARAVNRTLSGQYDCSAIDPIPITPELLEKAGFKYFKTKGVSSFENDYNDNEDTHCWSFTIKRTDLIDSHEISLVKWGEEEYFTFQLGRGTYRQRIKHLHKLQNLVHSLTGEELTINL